MRLRIYHALRGTHVHCRVFVNGAKSGELVFRKEEFDRLLQDGERAGILAGVQVEFEEDGEAAPTPLQPLTPESEAQVREDFRAWPQTFRAEVFTDADGVRWINGERVADLPPGQMRSRLLGIPGTTEAERAARAAKLAEVFATGAVHIPSRLHEDSTGAIPLSDLAARLSSFKNIEEMADYVGDEGSGALAAASLEPLDYLEGFPDYERVLEARNEAAFPPSSQLRVFLVGSLTLRGEDGSTFEADMGKDGALEIRAGQWTIRPDAVEQTEAFDRYEYGGVEIRWLKGYEPGVWWFGEAGTFPKAGPWLRDDPEAAARLKARFEALADRGESLFDDKAGVPWEEWASLPARKTVEFTCFQEAVDAHASGYITSDTLDAIHRHFTRTPESVRILDARELALGGPKTDAVVESSVVEERLRAFREGFEALERPEIRTEITTGPFQGIQIIDPTPGEHPLFGKYDGEVVRREISAHIHRSLREHPEGMRLDDPDTAQEVMKAVESAVFPPKTDPNSLLLALFRWGEARAEEEIRLSPKLFALVTEAVFPSGETVLERFLATARVVKPYFRAEVSENGLKLTDLEGI